VGERRFHGLPVTPYAVGHADQFWDTAGLHPVQPGIEARDIARADDGQEVAYQRTRQRHRWAHLVEPCDLGLLVDGERGLLL
jgi:hypothetical protein